MNYKIDAAGKSLGRVASQAAVFLRGKNSPAYRPEMKPANQVTIENAARLKITGNKLVGKVYHRHSGYPGNLKTETLGAVIEKKGPTEVLRRAIYGMLPNNRQRRIMMNNLIVKE